jgi:hypothetical protein
MVFPSQLDQCRHARDSRIVGDSSRLLKKWKKNARSTYTGSGTNGASSSFRSGIKRDEVLKTKD